MTQRTNAAKNGFTLLEVMVVMLIVAMTSVALFNVLLQMQKLGSSISANSMSKSRELRQEHWFRYSTQGVFVSSSPSVAPFRGNSSEFSGLTFSPLAERHGIPKLISWRITRLSDSVQLRYTEGSELDWLVGTWSNATLEDFEFSYIDLGGKEYAAWPPHRAARFQLPVAIKFSAESSDEAMVWFVKTRNRWVARGGYERPNTLGFGL